MAELIGQKITKIRAMTPKELAKEMWEGENGTVIVLENGVKLFASSDAEGNGAGVIFGQNPDGSQFGLY